MKKATFLRIGTLGLAILMMVSLLVACGTKEQPGKDSKKQIVRIMTQFGENTKHNGIKLISDEVTKLYPQYEFQAVHLAYNNYLEKLKAQMAAGDPPTLFTGTSWLFTDFIKGNKVVDLTQEPWIKDYNEAAFSESKLDGKIWSMPYDFGGICVFYNKDMFTKYNLSVPTTRTEWLNVCNTLEKNGITPFAFGGSEKDPCNYTLEPWVFSNLLSTESGKVANKKIMDGELSIKDVPEYKKALSLVYEMFIPYIEKNDMGIPREKAYDAFLAGTRGMTIHGNFATGVLREADPNANIGVFPVTWSDNVAENKLQGYIDDNLMIAQDGVVDAGKKWMAYASSIDGLNIWAKAAMTFPSSKLTGQLKGLDPISKDLNKYFESKSVYFKDGLSMWSGNYGTEWQALQQKFIQEGIDAHAAGISTEEFITKQLNEMDKRIKALK